MGDGAMAGGPRRAGLGIRALLLGRKLLNRAMALTSRCGLPVVDPRRPLLVRGQVCTIDSRTWSGAVAAVAGGGQAPHVSGGDDGRS